MYIAAVGTALPADTVGAGTAWGGAWTQIGWTESAIKLTYEYAVAAARIQETLADVARWKSEESLNWETTLAEVTMTNVQYAIEGSVAVTAPGASPVHGTSVLALGGSDLLTVRAWGFEWNEYIASVSQPIRVLVYRGTASAGIVLEGGKDKQSVVALKGTALADMTQSQGSRLFKIYHITAEPSS